MKILKVDMREVLNDILTETKCRVDGGNRDYNRKIVARLWDDGDITIDQYDGNFKPINQNYIVVAESMNFYEIGNTLNDSLDAIKYETLYTDFIKDHKDIDEEIFIDMNSSEEIEYIEENYDEWFEEWEEKTVERDWDAFEFVNDKRDYDGEKFNMELEEFETEYEVKVEFKD